MRCQDLDQAAMAIKGEWEKVAQIMRIATLVVVLGLGDGVVRNAMPSAVRASTIAQNIPNKVTAASDRVESIDRQPEETYENLIKRAEETAQALAEQEFQQPGINAVSVMVLGQNRGEIAPILALTVSRQQWSNEAQAQRWATYFTSARSLLGFDNPNNTTANQFDSSTDTSTQDVDDSVNQPEANPEVSPEASPDAATQTPDRQPGTYTPSQAAPDTVPVDVPTPSPDGTPPAPTQSPSAPAGSTIINNNSSPGVPAISAPRNVAPTFPSDSPSNGTTINNPSSPSLPNNEGIIPNDNPPITPNNLDNNNLDSAPR